MFICETELKIQLMNVSSSMRYRYELNELQCKSPSRNAPQKNEFNVVSSEHQMHSQMTIQK